MKKKINEANFRYKAREDIIKLKFIVGVTHINENDQIIKIVDKCICPAKKAGKNTTICCKKHEKI